MSVFNFQIIKHWRPTKCYFCEEHRDAWAKIHSYQSVCFTGKKNQNTQRLSLKPPSISQLWMLVNRGSLLSWKERSPRLSLGSNSDCSTNQRYNAEKVYITSVKLSKNGFKNTGFLRAKLLNYLTKEKDLIKPHWVPIPSATLLIFHILL